MTMNYDKELLKKLKDNYFKAKALYECIKEQSEEIQRKVLAEHTFYATDDMFDAEELQQKTKEDKRIYEPDRTFLMDLENDFPKFLDLVYPEYIKAGISDKRGKEYIPEADAMDLMYEARKQLVDYAIEIIPDDEATKKTLSEARKIIKYEDKILNLILKLEC